MIIASIVLFMFSLTFPFLLPAAAGATGNYEDSLKQLAESVMAEAIKGNKRRLALMDFADATGNPTPLGRFLAEEIGTQVLVAGELNVVERTLVHSTLKKFHVVRIDPAFAKAVRRAAKAMRADVFVSGSYRETADGLVITARLISPLNAQVIGAVRGILPKAGPLRDMLKETDNPPAVTLEAPKEPPLQAGLGSHRNDVYELIVQSMEQVDHRLKLDLTIENRAPRDIKVLCFLQTTIVKDNHGAAWSQGIEENREGLCTRGLELSPREKQHAVLTFTAPDGARPSEFTLHYHEKSPRRDAAFTIDGLRVESGTAAGPAVP